MVYCIRDDLLKILCIAGDLLKTLCVADDLLKTLGNRGPQSKTPASVVLTLGIRVALAFAGKHKHALACAKEQALFSFIPSCSRFSRRLHSLAHRIPLLLPLSEALWEALSSAQYYLLKTCLRYGQSNDTLPLPVCENIRAPVPAWPPPANTGATFPANAAPSVD